MGEEIKVTVNEKEYVYPEGTRYRELAAEVAGEYAHDIILAKQGSRLLELNKIITESGKVDFVTTNSVSGHATYVRGATMMLIKAIYQVVGAENIKDVFIKCLIGNGYYCKIDAQTPITDDVAAAIKERMMEYVKKDIIFGKTSVNTVDAVKLFADYHMYDKEELFAFRRVSKVNLYDLGGYQDYYYGYMPSSTGILKYFDVQKYQDGLVLILPYEKTPDKVDAFKDSPKLFSTLRESAEWGQMVDVRTVGELNKVISEGKIGELILVQEALMEKKIAKIAEQIAESRDKKFIMIAGPSSSGKTSFSYRLSVQLRTFGLNPHPIGVDDYFLNREDTPLDENGNYNFECLEAIDVEQFNKDMTALLAGERVEIPKFNFMIGKREYHGNYKQLGPDDILVIEGIHGLNDKLSYSLPKESKFKIYISALSQLNIDEHNRIPTTDGRLLRRMVRDARTRGSSAAHTIRMWPSVRRGEDQYIFPFQEEADVMFNSATIYELAALKQFAEPILFGIDKNAEEYVEAKRLLKFLDYFIGIGREEIPKNSIIREFVGGSVFNV